MSSRPTLATLLRGRSRTALTRFVADLYTARGAETAVDDGAVVVDGERLLVVPAGVRGRLHEWIGPIVSGSNPEAPARVVAADPGRADALAARYDAPVLSPADLDDLARYGLDREAADAVFREHFGVGLDDVARRTRDGPAGGLDRPTPASSRPADGELDRTDGRFGPASAVATLVAVVVLAAAVVSTTPGVLGVVGVGPFESADREGPDSTATTTPTNGSAGVDAGAAIPRPPSTSESGGTGTDAIPLVPGLTTEGITDPAALADAHATTMANQSYTWRLTYVESANGSEIGRATETVRVAAPSVYVSNVTREGVLVTRGPVARMPSYADGERRYRLATDGVETADLDDADVGRQAARARQYFGVLLAGREMSVGWIVRGGPRRYVVDIDGTNASAVRNYSATVHVAPDGSVRYYSGSYCLASMSGEFGDICLSFTMRYSQVGETTVEPPPWYTAWNATHGTIDPRNSTVPNGTATNPTATPSTTNGTTSGTPTPSAETSPTTTGIPTR
ncbi:hypothetical protein [Salinigranum sp. GCM10025319]|uniref:hypothetical protein n=1 Tax=Salinigranum sp. GCM10025319 TaxID=3252687 RepID=UPI0036075206